MRKRVRVISVILIASVIVGTSAAASSISQIQNEKTKTEQELNHINQNISDIEDNRDQISEEIAQMNSDLLNILLEIDILETDLANKETEIEDAQTAYDEAKAKEESQYENMKKRIKYMYEQGDTSYLEKFLQAESISDLISKVDFSKSLYEADRALLTDYQETKKEVEPVSYTHLSVGCRKRTFWRADYHHFRSSELSGSGAYKRY